jgi:dynein heavy chain
LEKDLLP